MVWILLLMFKHHLVYVCMYNYVWLCDLKVYAIMHPVNCCFQFWYVITPHNVSLHCFPEIMVGFERTVRTVDEDVGTVEVCAKFTGTSNGCEVDFRFAVAIETIDNTAGILSCVTNGGLYSKYGFLLFQRVDQIMSICLPT